MVRKQVAEQLERKQPGGFGHVTCGRPCGRDPPGCPPLSASVPQPPQPSQPVGGTEKTLPNKGKDKEAGGVGGTGKSSFNRAEGKETGKARKGELEECICNIC